jgi:hypothetical protein
MTPPERSGFPVLQPVDVVTRAARDGLVVSLAIAAEALASVDHAEQINDHRARYSVLVWDGKTDPPIGDRDRWLHGQDAASKHALESFERGGVVYFVMRDGELTYWQPWPPESPAGQGGLMVDDESHQDHWKNHADRHVDRIIETESDASFFKAVLAETLRLHEERHVPYHAAITVPTAV